MYIQQFINNNFYIFGYNKKLYTNLSNQIFYFIFFFLFAVYLISSVDYIKSNTKHITYEISKNYLLNYKRHKQQRQQQERTTEII